MVHIPSQQLCREGLIHEDMFVRNECLSYLHELPHPGLEVTRAALQAMDRFGDEAFEYPHLLKQLPIDGETAQWVHAHIQSLDWEISWQAVYHYLDWLSKGPDLPDLLDRFDEDYAKRSRQETPRLSFAAVRDFAAFRLRIASWDMDRCFEQINRCFEKVDYHGAFPHERFLEAELLCDRMIELSGREKLYPIVEEWLDFEPDDDELPAEMSTAMGVYLAGRCGVQDYLPQLLTLFEIDYDWLNEYVESALIHMATPELFHDLRKRFRELSWVGQLYASTAFERHQFPGFESFCMEMLEPWDGDEPVKGNFAYALALYGAPEPLRAAQDYYNVLPSHPEMEPLGRMLYTQYRLRGIDYPAIGCIHSHLVRIQEKFSAYLRSGEDKLISMRAEEELLAFPNTLRSHLAKLEPATPGRNDPCPCGSGKKYKKCCLGKH